MITQPDIILAELKRKGSVTHLDAVKLGILHPGDAVLKLRKCGYKITTEYKVSKHKNRYGIRTRYGFGS
jgi:hypothetical protein